MAGFRFLHAADVHLDSPLHGIARYEGIPVDEIRGATRAAFDNLVHFACNEAVDFLLLAGDLFDGEWKDMATGLYFARAMARLAEADIPVFMLAGNHDAASVLTRQLPWPDNVRQFSSRRPETHLLPHLNVAIHGQSFANAAVSDNLAAAYPEPIAHHFNIGLLHTALGGHEGHEPYAPCEAADLLAKHYDYWALGHVHEHRLVHDGPQHIVFPGNLQGRHIRETGPKGAVLVEVEDNMVAALRHVPLDVLRWGRIDVDCSGIEKLEEIFSATHAALARSHAVLADSRPLVARIKLAGVTAAAGLLLDRQAQLRDEIRARAAAVAPDLWIEKVQLSVADPIVPAKADASEDLAALLAEAIDAPDLATALADEIGGFLTATAKAGRQADGDLAGLATDGHWQALLITAGAALKARLHGEEAA